MKINLKHFYRAALFQFFQGRLAMNGRVTIERITFPGERPYKVKFPLRSSIPRPRYARGNRRTKRYPSHKTIRMTLPRLVSFVKDSDTRKEILKEFL